MKAIYGALLGLLVATAANAAPVYDVCQKQVESYVTSQLKTTITDVTYEWGADTRTHRGRAWVRTPLCSGAFVFELRGNADDCHGPHYGRIPNYISQVWKYGACRGLEASAPASVPASADTDADTLAHPIPDCPNGYWPVAQYDWRGNFQGYKCEKHNDH